MRRSVTPLDLKGNKKQNKTKQKMQQMTAENPFKKDVTSSL